MQEGKKCNLQLTSARTLDQTNLIQFIYVAIKFFTLFNNAHIFIILKRHPRRAPQESKEGEYNLLIPKANPNN